MYSRLPNIVLAFHGCDQSVFDKVIKNGECLKSSNNDYDWLGGGIYFWEQNLERAKLWAEQQCEWGNVAKPAVIGAVIDLGNCLNLMDSRNILLLKEEYNLLKNEFELLGKRLPENSGKDEDKVFRRLDCSVIEHLHQRINEEYESSDESRSPFDSVRALYSEGEKIYENAGFREKTHIQICVRNPNCIKGYFNPLKHDIKWPPV